MKTYTYNDSNASEELKKVTKPIWEMIVGSHGIEVRKEDGKWTQYSAVFDWFLSLHLRFLDGHQVALLRLLISAGVITETVTDDAVTKP